MTHLPNTDQCTAVLTVTSPVTQLAEAKQRVEKRRYLSVCRRNRQHQYQRTHQNRQRKADGKHRRCPQSQMPLMHHKNLRLHDKSPPLTMLHYDIPKA